jgi:hypothetical protein
MNSDSIRDLVTVSDDLGNQKQYEVEALFDMNGHSYALLRDREDTVIMRVEEQDGEQYLVGLDNDIEKTNLLNAYQVAIEANPADQ